jgi:ATP-dependent Clp protease ATP-binding subunit ClpA
MFDRFNYRARKLVVATLGEAHSRRARIIEPEHLALALLNDDVVAPRFFAPPNAEAARAAIGARCGEPVVGPDTENDLPLSRPVFQIFKQTAKCARQMSHAYAGPEHVLLALLMKKLPAAALLRDAGITAETVRSAIEGEGEAFRSLDSREPPPAS